MAWVWPAITAATSIYSAVASNRATRRKNEQEVELSNTAIQRRMADLRKAGINPALAYTQLGPAQTPNLETPSFEAIENLPDKVNSAYMASSQKALLNAQVGAATASTAAAQAQARKANAEAQEIENRLPYGAGDAQRRSQMLDIEMQKLAAEASSALSKADTDWNTKQISDLTLAQQRELNPLMVTYQRIVNEGLRLGLSEKEVDAKFAEALGEEGKFVRFLRELFGVTRR